MQYFTIGHNIMISDKFNQISIYSLVQLDVELLGATICAFAGDDFLRFYFNVKITRYNFRGTK